MSRLQKITIKNLKINQNLTSDFDLSYQSFGRSVDAAPVVLVNHALTGNSEVAGPFGWWKEIIGKGKLIDLNHYAVIAFDVPGNGFGAEPILFPADTGQMSTKLIAKLYWRALDKLKISRLFAVIGGSLGGSIGWEMAFQRTDAIENLIPIACSPKASDWLIGNVLIQEEILKYSKNPVETARKHAMLLYRTPRSFELKFKNQWKENENLYAVESWLNYHGKALKNRFSLEAYQLMNYLLKTIGQDLSEDDWIEFSKKCKAHIHIVAVDSDYMFTKDEQLNFYRSIRRYKYDIAYYEINSIHGHDAFLIEYEQLKEMLNKVFSVKNQAKRIVCRSRSVA